MTEPDMDLSLPESLDDVIAGIYRMGASKVRVIRFELRFAREQIEHYLPDFVAETDTALLMIETNARKDVDHPKVPAKREALEEWCVHASIHGATYGGKPGRYALVPPDVVVET
jgi:hypothetical protein